jgi:putative transposase
MRDENEQELELNIRSRKTICHDASEYALSEICFVTVCIFGKYCFLGKVMEDSMKLSELGCAVEDTIRNINARSKATIITEHIIMPNHIHMIFDMSYNNPKESVNEKKPAVSGIVRDFKSYTTKIYNYQHGKELVPLWQRGYYDHRIRNEDELKNVREYIKNNPKRWAIDKFYVV